MKTSWVTAMERCWSFTSSKATLWVKAQHEGALPPPCIVRKDPRVPHQASPRGEAEDSTFLSSRDTDLLEPIAWRKGSERHPGKFPKVPGRRRGTRGFPAAP